MARGQLASQKPDIIPLQGGMDDVTTPVLVTPGKVLSSQNYEPDIFGGYRRMAGMERFDGRAKPSEASYYMTDITTTGTISVGDTIVGATSGATAKVLVVVSATSLVTGRYDDSTPFIASEVLNVLGVPQGTFVDISANTALTGELHASYKNTSADDLRADITVPPGSGPIRGVQWYKGKRYCFRNNAGGTALDMFEESTAGWVQITFGEELQFDNAVGQIFEGDVVTGLVSGASGTVKRALLRTGTWTVSGVGTLVFDLVVGGPFTDGEALQVSAATKADADGVESDITLSPDGKCEFDIINFTGASDKQRMYWVDGVNFLHEFDGTRIVPIRTGENASVDKPKFLAGHKNHMIVGIASSLRGSSLGTTDIEAPYAWTATTGAFEIALGAELSGILPQTGDSATGVLVATTDSPDKTFILYGNDASDFNLVEHSPDTGGKPYTLQNLGRAHYLDNKGIVQMDTTDKFGGFQAAVLSRNLQRFIDSKRGLAVASCVVRSKNQYRLFYSDGTGIFMNARQSLGETGENSLMPFDYAQGSSFYFNVVSSYIDDTGMEKIIAGGSDGMVYELDVGTSFDGDEIVSGMLFTFVHSGTVRQRKRYRRTVLQFRDGNTANISVGYDLAYGNLDAGAGTATLIDSLTAGAQSGGYWDSFIWEAFTWDAAYLQEITVDTPGNGESIAIQITGTSDQDEPFTIHTCILNYLQGRLNR
jgi:hypothetical protein